MSAEGIGSATLRRLGRVSPRSRLTFVGTGAGPRLPTGVHRGGQAPNGLGFRADTGQRMTMTTNTPDDAMTNFETLTAATIRLDEAERAVRIAEIRLNSLVPGAPLRYGVEATRRLRAADAELGAARAAYEAAQDLPAPEA